MHHTTDAGSFVRAQNVMQSPKASRICNTQEYERLCSSSCSAKSALRFTRAEIVIVNPNDFTRRFCFGSCNMRAIVSSSLPHLRHSGMHAYARISSRIAASAPCFRKVLQRTCNVNAKESRVRQGSQKRGAVCVIAFIRQVRMCVKVHHFSKASLRQG